MNDFSTGWLAELNSEVPATRKCLQGITEDRWAFKPHPRSMTFGYLALLVAEIPRWITIMFEEGEIDFATFRHAEPRTTADLLAHFEENVAGCQRVLQNASADQAGRLFLLKSGGKNIFSVPVKDYVGPTLNHWVHHRGQLTVYMRLNDIPVPSIYGPSADDRPFLPS